MGRIPGFNCTCPISCPICQIIVVRYNNFSMKTLRGIETLDARIVRIPDWWVSRSYDRVRENLDISLTVPEATSLAISFHGPTSAGLDAPGSVLQRGRMRVHFWIWALAGSGWPVEGDAGVGAGLELATGTFKLICIGRLQIWKI